MRSKRLLTILGSCAIPVITMAWLQLGRGRTPPIPGHNSVASLEHVVVGRFPQWILVRGHDRKDPILLFLHGGPGMPAMYLAHGFQRELERHFVVVQWDRLGAGKSFAPGIPPEAMTVEREIEDTRALSELLLRRFGAQKLYLVSHSGAPS